MELKKEQKDVGKLKQNNEKLKQEMASLRAMLAAQAKEGAASDKFTKEIKEKEDKIVEMERRIAEIEKDLAAAKAMVEKLEASIQQQKEESAKDKDTIKRLQSRRPPNAIHTRSNSSFEAPDSPTSRRRKNFSGDSGTGALFLPTVSDGQADYVSPEILSEHLSKVAVLEEELEAERKFRRDADGEIIKLRAKVNGVDLSDEDVQDLLAQKLDVPSGTRSVSDQSSAADDSAIFRYIFVVALIVLLMAVIACSVILLRHYVVKRISLHMFADMENEWEFMNVMNGTFTNGCDVDYEKFTHHYMGYFSTSNTE